MRPPIGAPIVALFVSLALIASACGSDSSGQTTTAPDSGTSDAGAPDATADGESGGPTDDGESSDTTEAANPVLALEVLEVESGDTTTIASTVTGDRPVLLWFWAPH